MSKFVTDRMLLNQRIEAAAMRPANDNAPSKTQGEVIARRASPKPSADYRKLSERLAKRQSTGDPRAVNDNQDWPLAEQLRRDGNEELLRVAERYKYIYESAHYEPKMTGSMPDGFWSPEQYHSINSKTGKLKLDGQKSSKAAKAMPVGDGTAKVVSITEKVADKIMKSGPVTFPRRAKMAIMGKWKGDDALIAAIDAKPMLYRLQAALGPLMDVFEDAVIGGLTLTAIGEQKGVNSQKGGAAGKVLVMMGLEAVRSELTIIDRLSVA